MPLKYSFLSDLAIEELAFLCEATPTLPTMLSRMEALEHLRRTGIPLPPRAISQQVRDAFEKFAAHAVETRTIH